MLLYKNRYNDKRMYNTLGFDLIIETEKKYIELIITENKIDGISITKKPLNTYEEYEMVLDECYHVIGFFKNIEAVLGEELLLNDKKLPNILLEQRNKTK